jgi:hypothetical protein
MTFLGRWEPGCGLTICMDTPDSFRYFLERSLNDDTSIIDLIDPFAPFVPLMDQVIVLYDQSVWSIRNLVRRLEKV